MSFKIVTFFLFCRACNTAHTLNHFSIEASHAVSLNLDEKDDDENSITFFAVYDGHGGIEMLFCLAHTWS